MHKIILTSIVALSGALATSCGDAQNIGERVATAETAMAEQDLASSRRICDEILGRKEKSEISAGEYARLSILYMQFYESADDSGALEQAVDCYRRSMELNPDSAKAAYASLPADDHKYAYALSMIVGGLDNPSDSSLDNDRYVAPDSIGMIADDEI